MREEATGFERMLKFVLSTNIVTGPSDAEAIALADLLEAQGCAARCDKSSFAALGAGLVGTELSIAERINAYKKAGPDLLLLQFRHIEGEFAYFVSEIMWPTPVGRRLAADAVA